MPESYAMALITGSPTSRVKITVGQQNYCKNLYRDFSDRYLGLKNSEILPPCFMYGVLSAFSASSGQLITIIINNLRLIFNISI